MLSQKNFGVVLIPSSFARFETSRLLRFSSLLAALLSTRVSNACVFAARKYEMNMKCIIFSGINGADVWLILLLVTERTHTHSPTAEHFDDYKHRCDYSPVTSNKIEGAFVCDLHLDYYACASNQY